MVFPTIIPASVLGANAPSKRINIGVIGVGGMGVTDLENALGQKEQGAYVLAVCDVDGVHRRKAAQIVNSAYEDSACNEYGDFREVTQNPAIDAVIVATPDHWHALPGIDAVRHGKDIYVEKPLTLTVEEGRVLVDEMRKHKRIGQTGTQQRSGRYFFRTAELIRNGRLGKISHVEITIPANNRYCPDKWTEEPIPAEFDYDMWLGSAPWAPFTRQRTHYQFRFILDYAAGQTTNWGAHYVDIAQWALDADEAGPIFYEGHGEFPTSGLFTTPTVVDFRCRYANGVTMRVRSRAGQGDGLVRFYGEKGWIEVSRRMVKAEHPEVLQEKIGENEIQLYRSRHHMGNFLECIRTRKAPVSDIAIGHRSTTICNVGTIAMQLGRPLEWDPVQERFANDPVANRMLGRAMRGPWSLA